MRCSIEGCDAEIYSRGWCEKHYYRWWRTGDAEKVLVPVEARDVERHFWARVQVNQRTACWRWLGKHYGGRPFLGKRKAHRLSYEINVGAIPAGLEVDHLCGNPWCVNPGHLEAVTGTENKRRTIAYLPETCSAGHPREHGQRCHQCDTAKHKRLGVERAKVIRSAAAALGLTWSEYVREHGTAKSTAVLFVTKAGR